MAETVAELDDLKVTWNFKNQSDLSKRGGRYRISALEPISSCRRVFKLEIIHVTADDEGVYGCHQTCRDSGGDVCKSSANFELKVTTGKKSFSAYRNLKRNSKEFNFVLFLIEEGWSDKPKHTNVALKYIACLISISRVSTSTKANDNNTFTSQVPESKRGF